MKKFLWVICSVLLSVVGVTQAQATPTLVCGDIVSDHLTDDTLSHTYTIEIASGTILIAHSDPLPITDMTHLSIEILNTNGSIIGQNIYAPEDPSATIETSEILSTGQYQIVITGQQAGAYQLFVTCVEQDGEVIVGNNLISGMTCGEQIDNIMIRPNELHRYYLYLDDDSVIDIFLESLYGDFAEMTFDLGLYSPTNQEIDRISETFKDTERTIFEQTITTEGIYRLYVQGFDSTDEDYRLSIDCTLPDGSIVISDPNNRTVLGATVLNTPTDVVSPPQPTLAPPPPEDDQPLPPFIIEQDLIEGIPNTGQLMGEDVATAYAFTGETGDVITVAYTHIRGESTLDLWLQAPDSTMIFTSGLLLADSLSAQITLPQTGGYQLFLTLAERPQVADAVFTVEIKR